MKKPSASSLSAFRVFRLATLLGLTTATLPRTAGAATYTWAGGGADGNWTTVANWQGATVPPSGSDTSLIFAGTSQLTSNQDTGGAFALNSLSFSAGAGAFTLSGGRLDFSTRTSSGASVAPTLVQNSSLLETINNDLRLNNTLTVSGSGNLALSGAIEGSGDAAGLTMAGTGTLTLTGNSNSLYTGTTTLQSGTLNVGSVGALGNGPGTIVFTGGTLQYSASNQIDYSKRFSQAASQAYRIDTNGQNVTYANGLKSNGGTLAKLGAGTLTLTGTNSCTGGTSVSAGTLALGTGGSITGGSGNLAVEGVASVAATFTLGSGNSVTTTGSILVGYDGSQTTQAESGTFTQSGGNVSADSVSAGYGTMNTGSYTLGTGSLSARLLSLGTFYGTGTFTQNGGTVTLSTTQSNAVGELLLGEANGTGNYFLNAGSLSAGLVDASNGPGTGHFTQTGGTVTVTGITSANGSLGGQFYVGQSGTGTYDMSGSTSTLTAGILSVGNGGGATGTFTQNAGTVNVTSANAPGNNDGGALNVGYGASQGTYTLNAGSVTAGALNVGNGSTSIGTFIQTGGSLTVTGAQANSSITGGPGALVLGSGGGTTGSYALSGADSLLTAGTIYVGNANGTGTFTQDNGTVTVDGTYTGTGGGPDAGTLRVANNGSTGSYTLNAGQLTTGFLYVGSNGSTSGTFIQNGGTVTVTGANTSGNTSGVNSALFVGANGSTGSYTLTAGTLTADAVTVGTNGSTGTFIQTGGTFTTGATLLSGGGSQSFFNLSGGTLRTGEVTAGTNGSPAIIVQSAGTWTAATTDQNNVTTSSPFHLGTTGGIATYRLSGTGSLTTGAMDLGNADAIGVFTQTAGTATINGSLTLNVTNDSQSAYNLNGGTLTTTQILSNGGTAAFNFNGGTLKPGTGAVSSAFLGGLSAASMRNGAAVIDTAGQNVTVTQALLHSTQGTVGNTVTITNGGSGYTTAPQVSISGGGGFGATAVATINAQGQVTGLTITSPGSNYTSAPTVTFYGGTTSAQATVSFTADNATDGGLVKNGAGALTLTGASTYNGGTQINGGTLLAANLTGSATGTGAVSVNNGGTLGGGGTVSGAVTVASGGTLAPGAQAISRLTLGSTLALQSGSTLAITLGGTTAGSGYDQVLVGGTLTLGGNLSVRTVNGFALAPGQVFTIIDNTGTSLNTTVFANVVGSVYVDSAGDTFLVDYAANTDGGATANDVTLRVFTVVPEPSAFLMVGAALGLALVLRCCRRVV